tara:strand:- start:60 stop:650 length:591 start_codon:yes stop_codon:yes gene_type:complete
MRDKDQQLINEAYYNMPPQCPPHLLEEGMSHQLHAWVMGKALPWLQKNKGKVAIAGGIAAALAMYMGMDPDTAQQAVDGMDPDMIEGLEGGDITSTVSQITGEVTNDGVFVNGELIPLDPEARSYEQGELLNKYLSKMNDVSNNWRGNDRGLQMHNKQLLMVSDYANNGTPIGSPGEGADLMKGPSMLDRANQLNR